VTANANRPPFAMGQQTRDSLAVNLEKEISDQKIEGYIADYFNTHHIFPSAGPSRPFHGSVPVDSGFFFFFFRWFRFSLQM
jgi:hypothetical protein